MHKYNMEKEIRSISFRSEQTEGNKVEGWAALYNQTSEYMGFYEKILPGAFDDVIKKCDCVLTIDHDDSTILARCVNGEGSLHLEVREEGLWFSAELDPTNERSAYLISALKRGDIHQCSFAFADVVDSWSKDDNGNDIRTIEKINWLGDVSCVVHPAYSQTSATLRNLPEINNNESEREERFKKLIDEIYSL